MYDARHFCINSWVYKIASLIDVSNIDEVKAKNVLEYYVNSIPMAQLVRNRKL